MSEALMIKEYGSWWRATRRDEKFPGLLSIEPRKRPHLEIMGGSLRLAEVRDSQEPIHGSVPGLGAVSLLAVDDGGFGWKQFAETTFGHFPMIAVAGPSWLTSRGEKHFRRVEIVVPSMLSMISKNPIFSGDEEVPPRAFGADGAVLIRPAQDHHVWTDDEFVTEWRLSRTVSTQDDCFSIGVIPTVSFSSRYPKSIEYWLDQWVLPTLQLSIVGTGSVPWITSIDGWHKRSPSGIERSKSRMRVFHHWIGESVASTADVRVEAHQLDPTQGFSMRAALDAVKELWQRSEVFLAMVLQALTNLERPVRNRYLDIAAGLEAYHAERYPVEVAKLAAHCESRDRILAALSDASTVSGADRQMAKGAIRKEPHVPLEHRIRQLLGQKGIEEGGADPSEIATVRNLIAHGRIVDDSRVNVAYEHIVRIACAVILVDIGILGESSAVRGSSK